MIITYLRSSSYNQFDFCEHSYYLRYTLGLSELSGKAAIRGSICHKALEMLARRKLAEQQNAVEVIDEELGTFQTHEMVPDLMVELSYKFLAEKNGHHQWGEADFKECRKLLWDALNWKNGMFSPLKRDIIAPEQFFDFTVDEPWAEYRYEISGKILTGKLSLRGTLDLVVKHSEGVELIDWKTGRKLDWATGKEKTYESLMVDPQLRLYHYAACMLYPEVDNLFVTIVYIKDGGPQSLCLQRSDLEETKQMVRKRFEEIKNTTKPKLIYPDWKCTKLCHWGKFSIDGQPTADYSKSICKTIDKELVSVGIEKVTAARASLLFNTYEGGGTCRDINRTENSS